VRGDVIYKEEAVSQFSSENTKLPITKAKRKTGGRPRSDSDSVRHKTIGVRVNKLEWEELQKKGKIMGMSPAQWLRTASLQRRLPQAPVPEINRQTYANLMRLAVNLNQIARAVNAGQSNAPINLLLEIRREVNKLQHQIIGLETDKKQKSPDDS